LHGKPQASAAFVLVHGVITGSAVVNIRAVTHPRMGTPLSSIEPQPLLEPPGL